MFCLVSLALARPTALQGAGKRYQGKGVNLTSNGELGWEDQLKLALHPAIFAEAGSKGSTTLVL
jgi:hypothetical protein